MLSLPRLPCHTWLLLRSGLPELRLNNVSEEECKAYTRCRNCGGPHRSVSRDCKASPNKFGPVEKKQLEAIRRSEHMKLSQAAHTKAAAKRAEEAIIASTNDVSMAEGSGFGVLESQEA